jgi:hypothetical protein
MSLFTIFASHSTDLYLKMLSTQKGGYLPRVLQSYYLVQYSLLLQLREVVKVKEAGIVQIGIYLFCVHQPKVISPRHSAEIDGT